MTRTVFLAATILACVLGVSAQQHNTDTHKSTLTIHVDKAGVFSGLGHEHEVRAPIHSGTADTGSRPAVEIHVNARSCARHQLQFGWLNEQFSSSSTPRITKINCRAFCKSLHVIAF